MEMVVHTQIFFVTQDMNLVPAKIRFKNYGVMKALGQITVIVLDKAALVDE